MPAERGEAVPQRLLRPGPRQPQRRGEPGGPVAPALLAVLCGRGRPAKSGSESQRSRNGSTPPASISAASASSARAAGGTFGRARRGRPWRRSTPAGRPPRGGRPPGGGTPVRRRSSRRTPPVAPDVSLWRGQRGAPPVHRSAHRQDVLGRRSQVHGLGGAVAVAWQIGAGNGVTLGGQRRRQRPPAAAGLGEAVDEHHPPATASAVGPVVRAERGGRCHGPQGRPMPNRSADRRDRGRSATGQGRSPAGFRSAGAGRGGRRRPPARPGDAVPAGRARAARRRSPAGWPSPRRAMPRPSATGEPRCRSCWRPRQVDGDQQLVGE